MRKSDKNKHKGEKNRFTATKSNRNLDNVRRVLQIHSASNIANKVANGAEKLNDAKESHVIIIIAKECGLPEIGVLRNFNMEHVHTEKTNSHYQKLHY